MKYIFFLFLVTFSFSQKIKFSVKDSLTHKPIEFVSIDFLNGNGIYSDKNGEVIIDVNNIEKIKLNHSSYETKFILCKNISKEVYLNPKYNFIKEITVTQSLNKTYKTYKNLKQKENGFCDLGMYGYEIAIPINIAKQSKSCYLDEITIPIKLDEIWMAINNIEELPLSIVKISFVENVNNKPSDSLIGKPEYYFIDKRSIAKKRIQHKLKKRVLVPVEGLFCVITFLGRADSDGNLLLEIPTYKSKILGKEEIFTKYLPIQSPIFETPSENTAFSRNNFNLDSSFCKIFPRTSTPAGLTNEESKKYLKDKINQMPYFTAHLDFKYYYYE